MFSWLGKKLRAKSPEAKTAENEVFDLTAQHERLWLSKNATGIAGYLYLQDNKFIADPQASPEIKEVADQLKGMKRFGLTFCELEGEFPNVIFIMNGAVVEKDDPRFKYGVAEYIEKTFGFKVEVK